MYTYIIWQPGVAIRCSQEQLKYFQLLILHGTDICRWVDVVVASQHDVLAMERFRPTNPSSSCFHVTKLEIEGESFWHRFWPSYYLLCLSTYSKLRRPGTLATWSKAIETQPSQNITVVPGHYPYGTSLICLPGVAIARSPTTRVTPRCLLSRHACGGDI